MVPIKRKGFVNEGSTLVMSACCFFVVSTATTRCRSECHIGSTNLEPDWDGVERVGGGYVGMWGGGGGGGVGGVGSGGMGGELVR